MLYHLNFPADPPSNVNFLQHVIVPVGYVINLDLHQVSLLETSKRFNNNNNNDKKRSKKILKKINRSR